VIKNLSILIKKSSYVADIMWQTYGNIFAQLINLVSLPIITRLYTPKEFGEQTIFLQITAIVITVVTFRLEYLINLPKQDEEADSIIAIALALCLFWIGCYLTIIVLFYDNIVYLIGGEQKKNWVLAIPAATLLICISNIMLFKIQRGANFKISGISEILNKAFFSISCILGAILFEMEHWLIYSVMFGYSAKIIYLYRYFYYGEFKAIINNLKFSILMILHRYYKISISATLSNFLMLIGVMIPIVMIERTYGSSVLGQYALVTATLSLPTSLMGNAIGQVYFQRAANEYNMSGSFNHLWKKTSFNLFIIGLPIYILIFIVSPFLYPIVFGTEWMETGEYAKYICVSAFFSFFSTPLDRGSLVVKASLYIICWHTFRTLTIAITCYLAIINSLTFESFLVLYVGQQCIMYFIDYIAGYYFSLPRKIISQMSCD
jgi:teichuronic acid exporter